MPRKFNSYYKILPCICHVIEADETVITRKIIMTLLQAKVYQFISIKFVTEIL